MLFFCFAFGMLGRLFRRSTGQTPLLERGTIDTKNITYIYVLSLQRTTNRPTGRATSLGQRSNFVRTSGAAGAGEAPDMLFLPFACFAMLGRRPGGCGRAAAAVRGRERLDSKAP